MTIPGMCGDKNCNCDREQKMVVVERDENGKPTVWCDPCLADWVKMLNENGIKTVASCCGHGRVPPTIMTQEHGDVMLLGHFWATEKAHHLVRSLWGDING